MNKRLLITIVTTLLLAAGTFLAIQWGRGYRPDLQNKVLAGTGLLSANSFPKGAQVYINDKLTTATDDTLNLPPGDYQIKILKDGYIPWEKNLKLEKELVTQTNAVLFPAVPDLKPLTFTGADILTPSPDGQKIAFTVASASAKAKNGLYVLELSDRPLSFKSDPRQITGNLSFDFTQAKLFWSPDSNQLLAVLLHKDKTFKNTLLLETSRYNEVGSLKDATARLPLIIKDWQEQLALKEKERIKNLPEEFRQILDSSTKNIYWSPDEEKLLYTATASAQIPDKLASPLPASNSQPESRQLEPGKIYVYDAKEDKNFYISDAKSAESAENAKSFADTKQPTGQLINQLDKLSYKYSPIYVQNVQWFPDSSHLILVEEDKIIIMEYDGANRANVYAGPFEKAFAYPWPNGSRLVTLTNFNKESPLPPNLYVINLK